MFNGNPQWPNWIDAAVRLAREHLFIPVYELFRYIVFTNEFIFIVSFTWLL